MISNIRAEGRKVAAESGVYVMKTVCLCFNCNQLEATSKYLRQTNLRPG